jgi:hypothetical protein
LSKARTLEVTFNASGAAEAGARGRVAVIVDVVDASTSAEAALANGAAAVLGAAPAGADAPVPLDPAGVGRKAAALAGRLGTTAVVVAEPRVGTEEDRRKRAIPVLQALRTASVEYELVANQGAELPGLIDVKDRVVVIVSTTGGAAFDAALAQGSPAACFATTARIEGKTGWDVLAMGARRAMDLADEHSTDLSIVAASANSTDDCLAAFEVARRVMAEGFLQR